MLWSIKLYAELVGEGEQELDAVDLLFTGQRDRHLQRQTVCFPIAIPVALLHLQPGTQIDR